MRTYRVTTPQTTTLSETSHTLKEVAARVVLVGDHQALGRNVGFREAVVRANEVNHHLVPEAVTRLTYRRPIRQWFPARQLRHDQRMLMAAKEIQNT